MSKSKTRRVPIDQTFDLPPFTPEEEEAEAAVLAAWERGDDEAALEHIRKIRFTPGGLLTTKKLFGADYIRKKGYNTELADKFLGPDWLDRDDL